MGHSNLILVSPPTCANRQNSCLHTYSSTQLRQLNTKVSQDNRLQVLPQGTISWIRQLKINKRPIRMTKRFHITNNCNWENLLQVKINNKIGTETASTIRLATLNARSVRNKDEMIVNKFIKAKIDIGLLTKTWLKDTPEDQAWVNQSDLTQPHFKLQQHSWQGNIKGGGIMLLYHKYIKARIVESGHIHTQLNMHSGRLYSETSHYTLWECITHHQAMTQPIQHL